MDNLRQMTKAEYKKLHRQFREDSQLLLFECASANLKIREQYAFLSEYELDQLTSHMLATKPRYQKSMTMVDHYGWIRAYAKVDWRKFMKVHYS